MPTERSLQALDQQLDTLLATLEHGDWDRLPDLEPSLLQALTAARSSSDAAQRKQIEALLQKLGRAIAACTQRKEQIAPLVNALATTAQTAVKA
ncbi:hypothetical protein DFR40_2988 [Azonexus fungiphilus]|jgi:ribosomal 50S subunit-associated protein YjgA (DUF615 family)|uniref:Protein FliT n=1 Tax=Azonexus fungiphilus TaxID=146940 RepID=A0A495VM23_9RHOO|nr:hypothetical protein [Azonexus fungiphilus]RKT50429.1 hypothetical protein DFR40_2988 [Azonexus fungiphilus]